MVTINCFCTSFIIDCFVTEWAIGMIKRKLYSMLRSESSQDWPHFLNLTLTSLNSRHVKSLGGVMPREINSSQDDVKIRDAQTQNHVIPFKEPDYAQQNKNQREYFSNKKEIFKVGTYVYIDRKPSKFEKSYDLQVRLLDIHNFCLKFFHFLCSTRANIRKKNLLDWFKFYAVLVT